MMQSLLAERFQLAFHHEAARVQGYVLVVAKGGLKIREDTSGESLGMTATGGTYRFKNTPLSRFAQYLSNQVGEPVVEKAGLSGVYSFTITVPSRLTATADQTADDTGPSIFTILQDQFGLRLEPQKLQMEVVVIDHAEKPSD